jgi:hypothetical protein
VSRKTIGKLRPGRSTLIITTRDGHKTKILLRDTFRVSPSSQDRTRRIR